MILLKLPWIIYLILTIFLLIGLNVLDPHESQTHKNINRAIHITAIFTAIAFVLLLTTPIAALRKGWTFDPKTRLSELITTNQLLPDEDNKNVDNLKPADIVIYLRYDCKDCHRAWPELKERLKDKNDVYIIYTRTPRGKAIRERYPITDVPSGIFIKNEKEYIRKSLYANGEPNLKNVNRLLELQQKQRQAAPVAIDE